MNKPELLLPVGNIEAFYAAIEGGADAIFVGLKAFNARGRAANFNNYQFILLLNEAIKNKVKVYVTLNTVIKNREILELLDTLWFLSKTKVAAIIIQDWGTFYLLRKHFPNLVVHASTQMANHNSAGLSHSKKLNFERVILARELTFPELQDMQKDSPIETEVFVHGALCYSFSGMCMFSSYLGGSGANRGLCTQPCRRFYTVEKSKNLAFSLKDNQLVDFVPELAKIGVSSLKIEGRIKSGEYVYQVASAYRKVLDKIINLDEAKNMLKLDMGRDKTQWFYAKNVSEAITKNPNTGLLIGQISQVSNNSISLTPNIELQKGNRLRIRTSEDKEQLSLKIDEFEVFESGKVEIKTDLKEIKTGHEVYLAGLRIKKFPSKLKGDAKRVEDTMPHGLKRKFSDGVRKFSPIKKQTIFVRINTLDWLRKINLNDIDQLIIQFTKNEWEELRLDVPFLKKNSHKIWMELPQFISEKDLGFYKTLCSKFVKQGYKQFSLSHLSQKELLPQGTSFITNENVYCYNDAAGQLLKDEGAKWMTSPFENEFDNLLSGANRSMIIPMYYYPRLFYSRQPVRIEEQFKDDKNQDFRKEVRNGITIVVPEKPVALLQYREKLNKKGFNQFMFDLSFEKPSKHTLKRILTKFRNSEQEQPSTTFNFKKGLK